MAQEKPKRRKMRNKERDDERLLEAQTNLVKKALKDDHTTKTDISKTTGLTISEINNLFKKDSELYQSYCLNRRTLVDVASDNISRIVNDPAHPKHYDASKYILNTYKSDLDTVLDSKESLGEAEVTLQGGASKASPITIKFGRKKLED